MSAKKLKAAAAHDSGRRHTADQPSAYAALASRSFRLGLDFAAGPAFAADPAFAPDLAISPGTPTSDTCGARGRAYVAALPEAAVTSASRAAAALRTA